MTSSTQIALAANNFREEACFRGRWIENRQPLWSYWGHIVASAYIEGKKYIKVHNDLDVILQGVDSLDSNPFFRNLSPFLLFIATDDWQH